MPFVTATDGAQLYWREWGQGAPMLFLSSLGFGSQMWDYQIAAFAEQGFRCIGFDRRGHGRSDQPARGYDHDTLADDIATLIEQLDLSGLTLIGHSMAGGEAVRYLTRHGSHRVERLICWRRRRRCCSRRRTIRTARRGKASKLYGRSGGTTIRNGSPTMSRRSSFPETSPAMMRWGRTLLQISRPVALACSREMVGRISAPRCVASRADAADPRRPRPLDADRTDRQSRRHELDPELPLPRLRGRAARPDVHDMDRLHADILQFVREI